MKQNTLAMAADLTFKNYRKPTRRDEFLKTMQTIIPWEALCEVIEPHYSKVRQAAKPSHRPWHGADRARNRFHQTRNQFHRLRRHAIAGQACWIHFKRLLLFNMEITSNGAS